MKKIAVFLAVVAFLVLPLFPALALDKLAYDCQSDPCSLNDFAMQIKQIITFSLEIVAYLSGFSIMVAGFYMIFEGANPGSVGKAKTILQYAIGGLVLSLAAYLIIESIYKALGVNPNLITL